MLSDYSLACCFRTRCIASLRNSPTTHHRTNLKESSALCYDKRKTGQQAMSNAFPIDTEQWIAELQNSGYKLTQPRITVVEIMAEEDHPVSPAEVYDLARDRYPKIGKMTVYRTLEKLEELNLIQRLHDGCHTYVVAPPDSCHLMICQQCGRTTYIQTDQLPCGIEESVKDSGFKIQSHFLQLYGICAECQARA